MDDYEDIEAAARHRDWQGCARLMFGLLYACTSNQQRKVSAETLRSYVDIWRTKHQGSWQAIPERVLVNGTKARPPALPEFPEDLDPADAEYENGLTEYYNGAFFATDHAEHTVHFATAIRSAVTARQINSWLRERPD